MKGLTCDITTRRLAEMRHDAMTAELDHRVKNVLARVLGVVAQTREGSHLMDDFVKALVKNKTETWIGSDTQWMLRVNRWLPRLVDYLLARKVRKLYESA